MSKQYFSFDPNDGFEFHDTAEQAKLSAEKSLQYCKDEAQCDGWPDQTDDICWGVLTERVQLIKEVKRPPTSELDEEQLDSEGNDWSNGESSSIQEFELRPTEEPTATSAEKV